MHDLSNLEGLGLPVNSLEIDEIGNGRMLEDVMAAGSSHFVKAQPFDQADQVGIRNVLMGTLLDSLQQPAAVHGGGSTTGVRRDGFEPLAIGFSGELERGP